MDDILKALLDLLLEQLLQDCIQKQGQNPDVVARRISSNRPAFRMVYKRRVRNAVLDHPQMGRNYWRQNRRAIMATIDETYSDQEALALVAAYQPIGDAHGEHAEQPIDNQGGFTNARRPADSD